LCAWLMATLASYIGSTSLRWGLHGFIQLPDILSLFKVMPGFSCYGILIVL